MLFRSNDTATTEIYTLSDTLSLHDALPISGADADASSPAASRWPCRACGGGEASVLLLPCRGWGGSAPCRSGGERGSSVPLTTIGEREGLGKIYKGKNGTRKIGRCSLTFLPVFSRGSAPNLTEMALKGLK